MEMKNNKLWKRNKKKNILNDLLNKKKFYKT